MEHKKKYHGGLLVFCLLCCVFLFGNCSNSFAYISQDYVDYAIDLFANNFTAQSYIDIQNTMRNYFTNFNQNDREYILNTINDYLTTNNISNLNNYNCIFIARFNQFASNGSPWRMDVYFCNNSSPNGSENLGFLLLGDDSIEVQNINSTDRIYHIRFELNNLNSNTFFTWYPNSTNLPSCFCRPYSYPNNDYSVVKAYNVACYGLPAIYAYTPLNNSSKTSIVPCILEDCLGNYNIVEPEEPSGDLSGDVSGDIPTIPSGDSGGNIDYTNQLNNINNSINNITNQISGDTQKVIDNQNQNTQLIVNTISGETQKIIENNNKNLDSVFDFDDSDSSFDEFLSQASGDFKNPYDINAINQGFLDSFDSSMKDDFIISWDGVNFSVLGSDEVNLIPSGEINFSAICRENDTIGTVKDYLSLFCICGLGVTMLSEFYNLVLATMGIGSYFYAETSDFEYDITTINPSTGRSRTRHIIRSRSKKE